MRVRRFLPVFLVSILVLSGCGGAAPHTSNVDSQQTSGDTTTDTVLQTVKDVLTDGEGKVEVTLDADVHTSGTNFPVLRVTPHNITDNEVQHWVEVLFEGNTAYRGPVVRTKADIEAEIAEYQDEIDSGALKEKDSEPDEYEWELSLYQDLIENLKEEWDTAPEKYVPMEADWKFYPYKSADEDEDLAKTQMMDIYTQLNGFEVFIRALNRVEEDYMLHQIYFGYADEPQLDELSGINPELSQSEAQELADDAIRRLGLGDWKMVYGYSTIPLNDNNIYNFEYLPEYSDVAVASAGNAMTADSLTSADPHAANLYYSSLSVAVWNGVVEGVILTSPMDVTEVIEENAQTISFDEVYDILKEYIQTDFADAYQERYTLSLSEENTAKILIDDVALQLFRVRDKESEDYLIVPAWVFSQKDEYEPNGKNVWIVINAMDGTVINERLGY